MNKFHAPFIALLAALSLISGYLMARATWISKVGITFFHKGYNLLKIWWQGAIAVFLMLMVLYAMHELVQRKVHPATARVLHICMLVLAITGLYLTNNDFHTDFTHRLLGRRLHYGFYLAWLGWILICLFYIFGDKPTKRGSKEIAEY